MSSIKPLNILIAGGGIIGASTAYHISRISTKYRPAIVRIIDKNVIGAGSTSESAGIVLTKFDQTIPTTFAMQTLLDLHNIDAPFIQCGSNKSNDDGITYPYTTTTKYIQKAKKADPRKYNLIINEQTECDPQYELDNNNYDRVIDARGVWIDSPYSTIVKSNYFCLIHPTTSTIFNINKIIIEPEFYIKQTQSGVEIGVYEHEQITYKSVKDIKNTYKYSPSDILLDGLNNLTPKIKKYIPHIEEYVIKYFQSGYTTYTPDGLPVFINPPNNDKPISFTGCNGYGISWAGGIGYVLAKLALNNNNNNNSFNINALQSSRFDHLTEQEFINKSKKRRQYKFDQTHRNQSNKTSQECRFIVIEPSLSSLCLTALI